MTRRLFVPTALALAMLPISAGPARAHHSTSEFDYTKTVAVDGVVKEVQWTNPHSYLQILSRTPDGETVQWGVEIGAPAINVKLGWRKDSVKVGDKVALTLSPARDGRKFGTLRVLTLEDGRKLNGVAAAFNQNAGQ